MASSISGNLTAFESIATTTVGGGGAASVTFSSIPATYTHLQIRAIDVEGTGSDYTYTTLRFNSDSGSNYTRHQLLGNGTSASSYGAGSLTGISANIGSLKAGYFSGIVIDILDYANTNKYKTLRSLSGTDQNGAGFVALMSGLWQSTSAINTVTFTPGTATFSQYSSFALYGIK